LHYHHVFFSQIWICFYRHHHHFLAINVNLRFW
jgi:hypothetical protein